MVKYAAHPPKGIWVSRCSLDILRFFRCNSAATSHASRTTIFFLSTICRPTVTLTHAVRGLFSTYPQRAHLRFHKDSFVRSYLITVLKIYSEIMMTSPYCVVLRFNCARVWQQLYSFFAPSAHNQRPRLLSPLSHCPPKLHHTKLCPAASDAECAAVMRSLHREGRVIVKGLLAERERERGKGWVMLTPTFYAHRVVGGVLAASIERGKRGKGDGVMSAARVCDAVIG